MNVTNSQDIYDMPILKNAHVHIKNVNDVRLKIKQIIDGGFEILQIITDFDRTLTKHSVNGVPTKSSYCIFEQCDDLPEKFKTECKKLCDKYYPIEISPNLTVEEKIPHMVEWWKKSEGLFSGLKIDKNAIDNAVARANVDFRDGCNILLKKLNEHSIPVLVFSAGLGDVITSVLRYKNFNYPNVHVISNFFKFKDSQIIGYLGPTIHVFNKNEQAIKNSEYFDEIKHRTNILLMGDSLGDANMAEGVPQQSNVLKIGFLAGSNWEDHQKQYMDQFDIVLVDDQTMQIPLEIVNSIL